MDFEVREIELKRISSSANQEIKRLSKLRSRKGRDREGTFLIEGEKMLGEAVASGARVRTILLREDGAVSEEEQIDWLRQTTVNFGGIGESERSDEEANPTNERAHALLLSRELFDKLASTETPQGVMAEVEKPAIDYREAESHVVLDRMQDPGNVGSIIRSAAAAGRYGVILLKGTADPFSEKVVRAAAGAIFKVPICIAKDEEEALAMLKKDHTPLIACSMDGEEVYSATDLRGKVAIVVGNEGSGLSDSLIENSDKRVRIPMSEGCESLNAAIAISILLFEKRRQDG
jgi:TrmH family RNA methyltransferase